MDIVKKSYPSTGLEIAVIGMAGRFPGARNINEFWDNLKNGVESISFSTDKELEDSEMGSEFINDPNFVRSKGGVLEDKDFFDAPFFGYTPKEATIMHPQLRIFHECAWEALENAGYDPDSYNGLIGLFAGAASSFYWEAISHLTKENAELGAFASRFLTDKDHLSTKISHRLNLKGPSFIVSTACSSTLVAIHLACRALLSGECDMALVGGVAIRVDDNIGYLYREGMIFSADGHCRAFDAKAKGIMAGDGAGVVALKSLEEALEDGDYIYGIIKSSAINNDGKRKVGYEAPSIDGQAEVIRTAHRLGEVKPESITYIEAHGTGTELGDPIEIAALKLAFNTNKKGFCGIGSIKTNMGHLDNAAGIASFIKTVMALVHKIIPPSLHFETPNPRIDYIDSPFYVNALSSKWESDEYPLRAGVSSFGMGGTNAHVVLEEAPEWGRGVVPKPARQQELILLSAKTKTALDRATENFVEYLKENPGLNFADAAYTLKVGRKPFQYRRMSLCRDIDEAIENFSNPGSRKVHTSFVKEGKKYLVFMFSGLGSQYSNMGLELYRSEPVFRKSLDSCFNILRPLLSYDIKRVLFPDDNLSEANDKINQTEVSQLVVFIIEYALAQLLKEWGIEPNAMIGYSFGEYSAACLSGVISLEDVLKLIIKRGILIEEMPEGAMLSVPLREEVLKSHINDELSIAIDNGPSCVVSGSYECINNFEKQMKKENRCICTRIKASRALHSKMMEPLLKKYEKIVSQITLNKPRIPYISNVTGRWITVEEAVNPAYWVTHLRETVRFADGVKELLKKTNPIFIEVGPGYDLGALVRHHINKEEEHMIINTLKHPQDKISDNCYLLNRVGRLWLHGAEINWQNFFPGEKRYRIPLPTYPFERQSYRVEGNPFQIGEELLTSEFKTKRKPDIADWFYYPSWKRSVLPCSQYRERENVKEFSWLVFEDQCGLGFQLVNRLKQDGFNIVTVKVGSAFTKVGKQAYTINPRKKSDYDVLFKEISAKGRIPSNIVHLWSVTENNGQDLNLESVDKAQDLGFYSLLYLAQEIGKYDFENQFRITVFSNNMQNVTGEEEICPGKATLIGAVKVIPQEYTNITCSSIDIVPRGSGNWNDLHLIDQLMLEFFLESPDKIVAYRSNCRWIQIFEPIRMEKTGKEKVRLKKRGVYLIIGGFGGIGFELAKYLAKNFSARLILTGRSTLPCREEREQWLETHNEEDRISIKIRKVQALENIGSEVLTCCADVANLEEMREVVALAERHFGQINGLIHAAGLPDGCAIHLRTREMTDRIFSSKVTGTIILDEVFKNVKLDFFAICSSLNSILALFGQVGYCAANIFQDAYALKKNSRDGIFTVSINWETWKEVGMGVDSVRQLTEEENLKGAQEILLGNALSNSEAIEVFTRILEYELPQVATSTSDLMYRLSVLDRAEISLASREFEVETYSGTLYPRPELSTDYAPPKTEFEKKFVDILKKFFGYEQVGVHDNFFEFGVTSLTMIRINGLLRDELDKNIPIVVMFEYPTINSLGKYLEQEEKGEHLSDDEFFQLEDFEETEDLLQQSISLLREHGGRENE